MAETVYVLELDDSGVKKIFRSEARAREEMLKHWYESYAKSSLERMEALIKSIREGDNEPYDDALNLKNYISTIQRDLDYYFNEGYLDGFARVYPAELEE